MPSFETWLAGASEQAPIDAVLRIHELHAAEAVHGNRHPLRDSDHALTVTRFDEAFALLDPTRPSDGRFNRVIGCKAGFAKLDRLVDFYEGAGIRCQLDILPGDFTPDLRQALQARGFCYVGASCTSFGAPGVLEMPDRPDVTVEPVSKDDLGQVLAIVAAQGDCAPPDAETVSRRREELARSTAFQIAVARVEGHIAAVATLFLHQGAAYLEGAITSPAWRNRGCQTALLRYRLREAARRGCTMIVTDTLIGVTSQRNVRRAGLRTAFLAGWWVRQA